MDSEDPSTVILSQRRRQAALIAATVCMLIAIILFISTKSFGEQPGYIFLICGAIMWPLYLNMLSEVSKNHLVVRLSSTLRELSPLVVVGLMGMISLLAVIMPRHFLETTGPLVLGVTFVGEFLAEVSILLVEDYGVSELFIGVCLSNVYETGAITNTWILYFLCTLLCTRKFVLPRLASRSIQPVPLDLDNLERRLELVNDEVRAVRELGQVTKLDAVVAELSEIIGDIRKAKGGRQ